MAEDVEIRSENGYAGVYAKRTLAPNELLLHLDGVLQDAPSRYSIQISEDAHILPRMKDQAPLRTPPYAWSFLNHSCDPNLLLDVEGRIFITRRTIQQGEELTFNYNTTEWDMAVPFECHCGAPNCVHSVRDFKHLPASAQAALLPLAAPHIRRRYRNLEQKSAHEKR